jgi:type I site-specific restriction-modification system R (restriction) subunit
MDENKTLSKGEAYAVEIENGFKQYGNILVVSDEWQQKVHSMTDKEKDMLAARLTRTYYWVIRKALGDM